MKTQTKTTISQLILIKRLPSLVFHGMSTFICRVIPEKFVYWLNMGCLPRPNARRRKWVICWLNLDYCTNEKRFKSFNIRRLRRNKLCLKFTNFTSYGEVVNRWKWLRLEEFIAQKYMAVPSMTLCLTRIKLGAALYLHDHK